MIEIEKLRNAKIVVLIPDARGGFLRCPDHHRCINCTKYYDFGYDSYLPSSYEKVALGDTKEDKVMDLEGEYVSEDDILAYITLDELIDYLSTFKDKRYADIFRMLFDQYTTKEIAEELDIPWSTAKDTIKRVRKLAQQHIRLEY